MNENGPASADSNRSNSLGNPGTNARPLLVSVLAVILGFQVLVIPFVLFFFVIGSSEHPIRIDGDVVELSTVRARVIAFSASWWVFAVLISRGLWQRREYARRGVVALAVAAAMYGIATDLALETVFSAVAFSLVVIWYFFWKDSVVEYFRRDSS